MAKTLYLLRHGEVDVQYNDQGKRLIHPPDAPLGRKGREQMSKISSDFQKMFVTIDALYSSPVPRAEQSAQVLAENLKIPPPIVMDGLKDVIDASNQTAWVGKPKEEYNIAFDIENKTPDKETVAKLKETLATLLRESPGEILGIVTHGNTAKVIMFLLEHPDEENIPTLGELKARYNLERAEGWKLQVSEEGKLIEAPKLFPEREIGIGETEGVGRRLE